ncbi:DUF1853 domain-containing protein [Nonlabens sp. MB-3u-79]|uniref:DUF1853 family protein n=1 Tax=Nonlabens sp. MB-3u-79 TaxID=2058134 RepID=UPI000C31B1A5|nr:DUF1853 family protein [Nonlabens sp. MB-3u-79]AUC79760.1 DUF1853 domain-containing protein [Nonlabens sp. MB-3u-79]
MQSNLERFKAFYKTASLWSGTLLGLEQFGLSNFIFDHLKDQESLDLPVIPQGTLLGKRAEYFFKFCVEQSSNYQLLLSNIQIFKGKITKGELDYVIKDLRTNSTIHIELVYKFYIYNPTITSTEKSPVLQELNKYQGPNGRDNLVRKLEHLKNHQLPLLYTAEAVELLKSHDIAVEKIKQQVCFLAHVFIPHQLWDHKFKYIHKSSITGYYYKSSAFAKAETENTYFLPEKYAWKMTPQELLTSYTFHEALALTNDSLERGFAPLLWMQLTDKSFETFFVVK